MTSLEAVNHRFTFFKVEVRLAVGWQTLFLNRLLCLELIYYTLRHPDSNSHYVEQKQGNASMILNAVFLCDVDILRSIEPAPERVFESPVFRRITSPYYNV